MKGATDDWAQCKVADCISIHAPVKGATQAVPERAYDIEISIHAPVKGATSETVSKRWGMRDFNPRSREGSDVADDADSAWDDISIHAPVKGATTAVFQFDDKQIFQSTLP